MTNFVIGFPSTVNFFNIGSTTLPVVKSVVVLVWVILVLIGVYDSVNGSAVLLDIDLVAVVFVASL